MKVILSLDKKRLTVKSLNKFRSVKLFNSSGNLVTSLLAENDVIDVSGIDPGVYKICITDSDGCFFSEKISI